MQGNHVFSLRFFILGIFTILLSGHLSHGFEQTFQEKKIEGISLTETIKLPDFSPTSFKAVSHGLRKKPVAFISVRVYVGELLLPSTATWDGKTKTFENSAEAGVMMTFLRDVPAKNIAEAFVDGLEENKANMESPEIKAFLAAVKKVGDIKKKEIFIIARRQKTEGDDVLVMIPNRPSELVSGPAGWSQQILKIWSGKPSDSGVKDLQKALFK